MMSTLYVLEQTGHNGSVLMCCAHKHLDEALQSHPGSWMLTPAGDRVSKDGGMTMTRKEVDDRIGPSKPMFGTWW